MQKHYVHGVAEAQKPETTESTPVARGEPQTPTPMPSDTAVVTPSPIPRKDIFSGAAVRGSKPQLPKPRRSKVKADAADNKRLVLVFRMGDEVVYKNDTGVVCKTLEPRKARQHQFGHIQGLDEGKLYRRKELLNLNGHCQQQRGVSGNKEFGCDAIIVSGLRDDKLGHDELFEFTYFVEQSKGALGVLKSANLCKPIRVFRSTTCKHKYQATRNHPRQRKFKFYRYDGLYYVTLVKKPEEKREPWVFLLSRAPSCPMEPNYNNKISNDDYIRHCRYQGTMPGESANANEHLSPYENCLRMKVVYE